MEATRSGFLTIYSADRTQIFGEFADGEWNVDSTCGGRSHIFSGVASDSTLDTFRRIDVEGIDHVSFAFESDGETYSGSAQLLRPDGNPRPGAARVRIECLSDPVLA